MAIKGQTWLLCWKPLPVGVKESDMLWEVLLKHLKLPINHYNPIPHGVFLSFSSTGGDPALF